MKRIGVDAHVLTGKFQGSRTYLLNLLRHLAKIDTVNRYILYSWDPDATGALLPFPNFEHARLAMRPAVPRLLLYWPWEIWRRRLDLLLTSYFAPLIYSARQIVIVHDVLFESHPEYFGKLAALRFRLLVRLSALRARAVIAVSQTTRAEILARYRIPPDRVHLVLGGIDPAQHSVDPNRPPPAGLTPYVLAVGRLEPRKNIPTLLQAFRLMRTHGIQLVVIGREDFAAAPIAAALRALQAEPGFAGRVTWLQHVPDADLPWYYRHAAVFAFPSFAEGFGLPLLEALVQSTPVVAADHPAMREVAGPLALYFPPDSPADLAALLDQAITGPRPTLPPGAWNWTQSAAAMFDIIESKQSFFEKKDQKTFTN
jgi:glycosyltransferase involved in cell wall biosynthesis